MSCSRTQGSEAGEAQTWGPLVLSQALCTKVVTVGMGKQSNMESSGPVVECLSRDRGVAGRASPASLCCVLEQDTLVLA